MITLHRKLKFNLPWTKGRKVRAQELAIFTVGSVGISCCPYDGWISCFLCDCWISYCSCYGWISYKPCYCWISCFLCCDGFLCWIYPSASVEAVVFYPCASSPAEFSYNQTACFSLLEYSKEDPWSVCSSNGRCSTNRGK